MPVNTKTITDLAAFGAVHDDDVLLGTDVHDTTMAPAGTDKKLSIAKLRATIAVTSAGTDGQVQVRSGPGFAAIPGVSVAGGIAMGPSTSSTGNGNLALGNGCTVSGAEGSGCIAAGFESEVVDGTGQSGVDWAYAFGARNRSQGCATFVTGSQGLGYSRNQFVVGGGDFDGTAGVGAGLAQVTIQPLVGLSTDATAVTLQTSGDGAPGNTVFRPVVRSGFALAFDLTIVGRKTDGSKFARFKRSGLIRNQGGTTALEGTVQTIGTDINTPGWSVAVTADDANDAIKVTVTGEATVHWAAELRCVEVG